MGDSITDNLHNSQRFGPFFPGKPYINRGIGGQVTGQMLLRFYPDVIVLQPKAVVIFGGTNDIGGNIGPVPLEATEKISRPWPIWRAPTASKSFSLRSRRFAIFREDRR